DRPLRGRPGELGPYGSRLPRARPQGAAAAIIIRGNGFLTKEAGMRIAVTGASGFLGRYLVRRLARAGHALRCWHRPNSDRSGFGDAAGAVEWLPGSLGDAAATAALVRQTDAVVHAAVDWAGRRNRAREGRA